MNRPPPRAGGAGASVGAMRDAFAQHQRGDLAGAAAGYRIVLAADPDNADANDLLGLVLHQQGRHADGAALIERAIRKAPGNAVFRAHLGSVLKAQGRLTEAIGSFEQSLKLAPKQADTLVNLGVARLDAGQADAAADALRGALVLSPRLPEAHANLGLALARSGKPEAAVASYRKAVEYRPGYVIAQSNLAIALAALGQMAEAAAVARQAVALQPQNAAQHQVLGSILMEMHELDAAAASLTESVRLQPTPMAQVSLGKVLVGLGRAREGAASLVAAIAGSPDDPEPYAALGHVLMGLGDYTGAAQSFARYVGLRPNDAGGHSALAGALLAGGQIAEALGACRVALSLDPGNLAAMSVRAFTSNYGNGISPLEAVAEGKAYGAALEARVRPRTVHTNVPDRARRLRIGLVSGDMHKHPVARFLEAVLAALDPAALELFVYSTGARTDEMTARLRQIAPNWRNVQHASAHQLEAAIVGDGIDILVDLSGHTSGNRLEVFARKPAPIAVTYLGYFATTGLSAIDYVLCNRWIVPEDEEDQWVETPWRLPETYLCFSAPGVDVPVALPPAVANGFVTFGSANNLNKLSDETVACWAKILATVPNSRLLLRTVALGRPEIAEQTRARFTRQGVAPHQLILTGAVNDYGAHLAAYGDVDIALDPFPYAGGTTSIEALWMGVPVLTLTGDRYVSRMGINIMENLGAPEWIAIDADDYVRKALAFAGDVTALAAMRAAMRARLEASSLMDAPRFARQLEQAFRGMWEIWCDGHQPPSAPAA